MKDSLLSLARGARDLVRRSAGDLRDLLVALWRLAARAASARAVRRTLSAVWAVLRSATQVAAASSALALSALGALWLGFERVPAGAIGVKQSDWGDAGLVEQDFAPGLQRSLRGWSAWHLLDGRTHFLTFGWETDGAALPVLDLRTKDGNEVKVSATVPYRIRPGEGWQLVRDGFKSSYKSLARTTAESLLMQEFANLSSSDFADTDVRLARCAEALPRLNALLAPYHLEAETIQIHQVLFWIEYEKKLQAKQLTRQLALEAEAAAQVEEERRADTLAESIDAEEKQLRAEMDMQIEQMNADSQRAVAAIRREAQTYDELHRSEVQATYAREVAEGELALARAQALKDRLTHQVYDTAGGRILLAREAARNLRIKQVTLDSSDPRVPSVLDLDQMVQLLIGRAPGQPVAANPR